MSCTWWVPLARRYLREVLARACLHPSCPLGAYAAYRCLISPKLSALKYLDTEMICPRCEIFPLTLLLSLVAVLEVKIRVPGKSGLKVFLMYMGTPADTAGCMVLGWITFAPK